MDSRRRRCRESRGCKDLLLWLLNGCYPPHPLLGLYLLGQRSSWQLRPVAPHCAACPVYCALRTAVLRQPGRLAASQCGVWGRGVVGHTGQQVSVWGCVDCGAVWTVGLCWDRVASSSCPRLRSPGVPPPPAPCLQPSLSNSLLAAGQLSGARPGLLIQETPEVHLRMCDSDTQ